MKMTMIKSGIILHLFNSSWLLRIVLDKIALIDRDINHWSIKEKIMSHLPDKL